MEITKKGLYWKIAGNYWSKVRYTLEEAKEVGNTLVNCIDCVDCENCENCEDCMDCRDCENCEGCYRCENCTGCVSCNRQKDSEDCIYLYE